MQVLEGAVNRAERPLVAVALGVEARWLVRLDHHALAVFEHHAVRDALARESSAAANFAETTIEIQARKT